MDFDHRYTDKRPEYLGIYSRICDGFGPAPRILELGVLNGGSLNMWQAAMPDATVVGVDINPAAAWPDGTVRVVANQVACADLVEEWGPYDLVVDDASHRFNPTLDSFQALWPQVKPGGWYAVEDWDAWQRYPHERAYEDMDHIPRLMMASLIAQDGIPMAELVAVPGLVAVRKAL